MRLQVSNGSDLMSLLWVLFILDNETIRKRNTGMATQTIARLIIGTAAPALFALLLFSDQIISCCESG